MDNKKDDGVVKGVAKYRLKAPHYRQGRYYKVGDVITVEDEKPSKTWERIDDAKTQPAPSPAKPEEPAKGKRPSEKDVTA